MDIHKPKPWHGLREFLKEYVIIVVGVATALSAEAGVEWLHWRHAIADSRAELAADARNIIRVAAEREAQSPCLARQFAEIQGILDRAAVTGRLEPVAAVNGPTRRAWTIRSFEPAASGQVLPHMPVQERGLMTGANLWSLYIQKNRDEEVRAWAELRTLEGPGRKVSDVELANLRSALTMAILQAQVIRGGSRHFAGRLVATGLNSPATVAKTWREGLESKFRDSCGGDTDDIGESLRDLQRPRNDPPPAEDWQS